MHPYLFNTCTSIVLHQVCGELGHRNRWSGPRAQSLRHQATLLIPLQWARLPRHLPITLLPIGFSTCFLKHSVPVEIRRDLQIRSCGVWVLTGADSGQSCHRYSAPLSHQASERGCPCVCVFIMSAYLSIFFFTWRQINRISFNLLYLKTFYLPPTLKVWPCKGGVIIPMTRFDE